MSSSRWLTSREQQAWRAYLAATRLLSARLDQELVRTPTTRSWSGSPRRPTAGSG
jgi:hypothetical protein